MTLLGKGALVIWHDPEAEAESDYNEWHSKEHMFERVGIPGFRRGQRGVAVSGAPRYFNLYEVDDFDVLTSPAYLARLDDPTAWTRRIVPQMHNNSRTLCRVAASFGAGGIPSFWTMLLLSPDAAREAPLRAWLVDEALPRLVERPGILSAHLLDGDPSTSGTDTAEKRLRGGGNEFVDWVLLIGGYDDSALATVADEVLTADVLASQGAASSRVRGIYRLVHCVTEADVPHGGAAD
jgi:hypothetical protein